MDTSLFWTHKTVLEAMEVDCGFSLFSSGHLLWIIGIALWAVVTALIYRKCDERQRDNFRKVMAIGIILLEAVKICVMGMTHVDICEHLPIHLCSLAGLFIVIDALWPNTRFIPQLFLFAFTAGALMSIVFSSATAYPFFNFYSMHIFIFHGYLFVYPFMRLAAGEYKPAYYGIWLSTAVAALLALPISNINGIFDVNYMFLGHPSDISLLIAMWDIATPIGGKLLYTVFLGALAVVCMHVMYLLYRLPDVFRFIARRCKIK